MRRRFVVSCAALHLVLVATPTLAQSIHVGAKIGPTHARLISRFSTGEPIFEGDRLAASAGWVARVEFSSWLALQAEVLHVGKGFDGRYSRMHTGYVEVPLLGRLSVPLGVGGLQAVVLAGVAPALEIACGGRTVPPHIPEAPPPPAVPLDCADMRTHLGDRGVVGGAGLSWRAKRLTITAEARSTRGRSNIASGYAQVDVRNRTVAGLLEATLRVGR